MELALRCKEETAQAQRIFGEPRDEPWDEESQFFLLGCDRRNLV